MKGRLPTSVAEFLKVWGVLALLILAGFAVAYQYVGAAPPNRIRMAAGPEDGAYHAFARQYARLLAADGITVEVVPTAGSVENLERLRRGDVSLALVQGGCASDEDREELESLGSLFLEPVWVFTRSETNLRRLSELDGRRVAVGARGSGTQVLSRRLLAANGVTEANAELIQSETRVAAGSLFEGAVDAAIFVASTEAPFVRSLFERPGIDVLDMDRTGAYGRHFPFLTPVTLVEGVIDLERNVPQRDTRLVAAAASLAAPGDLHPGLVPALLNAATRVHASGCVLDTERRFPSADFVDLPLDEDARRYILNGPSLLYRWLPYQSAVLLDRLKVLILPFVALLLPLFRIGPPLYQWRIRSRIYRWYAAVRDIDALLLSGAPADLASVRDRLNELEREVASVSVPLAYAGEQYHLRLHLRLLQERVDRLEGRAPRELGRTRAG